MLVTRASCHVDPCRDQKDFWWWESHFSTWGAPKLPFSQDLMVDNYPLCPRSQNLSFQVKQMWIFWLRMVTAMKKVEGQKVAGQKLTWNHCCSVLSDNFKHGGKKKKEVGTSWPMLGCLQRPDVLLGKGGMGWILSWRRESEPRRSFPLYPPKMRFLMDRNHLWCWAERGKSMANKISKGRDINIL